MNDEYFQRHIVDRTIARMKHILDTKGREYASDLQTDRLENFKKIAEEAGISPLVCWHIYAAKHWRAINNFVRVGETRSEEDIQGRFDDLLNYLLLGLAIIDEEKEQKYAEEIWKRNEEVQLARKILGDIPATDSMIGAANAAGGANKALRIEPNVKHPTILSETAERSNKQRKGPHHVKSKRR